MHFGKSIFRSMGARQERRLWRLSLVSAAVIITLAALYVDGFPPKSWRAWLGFKDEKPVAAAMLPHHLVPGQETVTLPKPRGNDSSLSPVPQALVLVSTQLGRNSREGIAQLGVDASSPQTYAAGAILANGARLTEIYPDHVMLERDGQAVRLNLMGTGAPTVVKAGSLTTVGGVTEPQVAPKSSVEPLTAFLVPSPVYEGEVLKGYQVNPGEDIGVFAALGLEAGDVIVAINGLPVTTSETALAELRTLGEGSALTAEIRRAGVQKRIALDGAVIREAMVQRSKPKRLTATGTST